MRSARRIAGRATRYERSARFAAQRPTIAFAGGMRKHQAVLAALKGGWLSGLVTDEACARAALGD